MDRFVEGMMTWVKLCLGFLAGVAGVVISYFQWPAEMTGISAEIWAATVTCVIMVALWRALGGYFD
jgi:tetrahydromethanopterin S-methyltransferase subunit C